MLGARHRSGRPRALRGRRRARDVRCAARGRPGVLASRHRERHRLLGRGAPRGRQRGEPRLRDVHHGTGHLDRGAGRVPRARGRRAHARGRPAAAHADALDREPRLHPPCDRTARGRGARDRQRAPRRCRGARRARTHRLRRRRRRKAAATRDRLGARHPTRGSGPARVLDVADVGVRRRGRGAARRRSCGRRPHRIRTRARRARARPVRTTTSSPDFSMQRSRGGS